MSLLTQLRRSFDAEMLRSLRWQYFLNIGIGVLGAAFLLAVGRMLGAEQFGVYTLCMAIPAVIAALLDQRLQEFVLYIREHCGEHEFPGILAALFWLDVAAKLLLVVLSLATAAVLISAGYDGLFFGYVALSASQIFATKTLNGSCLGVLRSFGELEFYSIVQVLDWFLRLVLVVALYLVGVFGIPTIFYLQIVVGGIFNCVVARRAWQLSGMRQSDFLAGPKRLFALLPKQGGLIFATQAVSAMDSVVKELDVIVAGIYLSVGQIGTYKIAKSLAAIAWRLADPVYIIVLPKLAKLHAANLQDELNNFTRSMAKFLVPAALGLYFACLAGVLLLGPIAVGPGYSEAIALYPYASAWMIVALPLIWTHSLAIATGRPILQFLGGGLGNGFGLIAIWLGAAFYGIEGAAVGLSLAYCLPFVFSFFFLRRFGIVKW